MASITNNRLYKVLSIIFWISLWEVLSLILNESLFLPSPLSVFKSLLFLLKEGAFYISVLHSIYRVTLGFFIGLFSGLILSRLSYKYKVIEMFLDPIVKVIRATPVASIVILILVWLSSKNLSVAISSLIVFPVFYTNMFSAYKNENLQILELATCYRIKGFKKFRYIHLPLLLPSFLSSLSIALGLAWKSAIAAEVIALPHLSIGENLYEAKVYLATPLLFAWTIVIILLAIFFEKVLLSLIKKIAERVLR